MKKLMFIIANALMLSSCTDAERSSWGALGSQAEIVCYSGGQEVFRDISSGKVMQLDGDGISYKSTKTGEYIRAFADCIVSQK